MGDRGREVGIILFSFYFRMRKMVRRFIRGLRRFGIGVKLSLLKVYYFLGSRGFE